MDWNMLLANIINCGIGAAFFTVAYIANMIFSFRYNIKILGQPFDKTKIYDSIWKIFTFGVGVTLICAVITGLPSYVTSLGFTIPEEYASVFNIGVIILGFLKPTYKYVVEAVTKMNALLDKKIIAE